MRQRLAPRAVLLRFVLLSALSGCSTVGELTWYADTAGSDAAPDAPPGDDVVLVDDVPATDDVNTTDASAMDALDGSAMDAFPEAEPVDVPMGGSDAGLPDVVNPADVIDVPVPDVVRVDVAVPDSGSLMCLDATECHPYFCGCGACTREAIQCVHDDPVCPLGCPMLDCPLLDTVVCDCVDNSCQRLRADLPLGAPCGVGLGSCAGDALCCYPCAHTGCVNVCATPEATGRCPTH